MNPQFPANWALTINAFVSTDGITYSSLHCYINRLTEPGGAHSWQTEQTAIFDALPTVQFFLYVPAAPLPRTEKKLLIEGATNEETDSFPIQQSFARNLVSRSRSEPERSLLSKSFQVVSKLLGSLSRNL